MFCSWDKTMSRQTVVGCDNLLVIYPKLMGGGPVLGNRVFHTLSATTCTHLHSLRAVALPKSKITSEGGRVALLHEWQLVFRLLLTDLSWRLFISLVFDAVLNNISRGFVRNSHIAREKPMMIHRLLRDLPGYTAGQEASLAELLCRAGTLKLSANVNS